MTSVRGMVIEPASSLTNFLEMYSQTGVATATLQSLIGVQYTIPKSDWFPYSTVPVRICVKNVWEHQQILEQRDAHYVFGPYICNVE